MSIIDSPQEHAAAAERLSAATNEQLTALLAERAISARDAMHRHHDLREQMAAQQRLYAETEAWTALIGEEMRARRDERAAPSTEIPAAFREALEGMS